jgi:hypothetical protein
MITIRHTGSFRNTERLFDNAKRFQVTNILTRYGQKGVSALSLATPVDTGQTAFSWRYRVIMGSGVYQLVWYNDHVENGISPAILIQYGHGTRGGGYVSPIDYINPAMRVILDGIAEDIWKEVTRL